MSAAPQFDPAYAFFVGSGLVLGFVVKTAEERRLQLLPRERQRWVTVGAILGAIAGAKLGLLLYMPASDWWASMQDFLGGEWGGRTILGALFGGFVGVEVAKKALGITVATGDPYAIALPLGQGLGRIGCFIAGCCYGAPISEGSAIRHPAQLYEAFFDFAIAGALFAVRKRPRPGGELFRTYLLAYAIIRFALDVFRGDEKQLLGPLSYAQWFCLACGAWLVGDIRRRRRAAALTAPVGA